MMSGTVPLARRHLTRQRLRLALSAGGVGLALLMILALDGIYTAILDRVTAYPDNQGAPLIASQRGVSTMHMSTSTIGRADVERLARDPRVERAEPILYTTLLLGRDRQAVSYVIGFRERGGPWEITEGRGKPRGAEIVLDERTASQLGVGVGSRIGVLGADLRVVGLAGGASSVITGLSFVDYDTFARAVGTPGAASYVLVWPRDGDPGGVARELERDHRLTVQTREQFSGKERQVISDMSTGLIRGMLAIGIVVGLAVAAVSIYTATVARLNEYAVLKAIGMRNRALYSLVSRQSLLTVAGGLALALALVAVLAVGVPLLAPSVNLVVSPGAVARTAGAAALIALVAAFIPARRVARVDPASVYRR
jgi:putative ABC transport system permease protein